MNLFLDVSIYAYMGPCSTETSRAASLATYVPQAALALLWRRPGPRPVPQLKAILL